MRYVIIPKFDYKSEPVKASSAEDALIDFATTMDMDMNLYFEAIPENEYQMHIRENLLMETAMRIQEVFDDMWFSQHVNPDKVDATGSIERLQIFRDWAREFEDKYRDTERYEDDFIGLSEEFAETKIKEVFG